MFYAWFTFSSRLLVETFGKMWTRQSTHECRHSHFHARTVDNKTRHSYFHRLGTDLSTCFWELWDEMRTGREYGRRDECTLRNLVLILSLVLVDTFGDMWMRQSTHKCRHTHSRARIIDNKEIHSRHSRLLWLGTDLPTCLRELQDEMRIGWECWRRDVCTLHILVLSRWECKPGITVCRQRNFQYFVLPDVYIDIFQKKTHFLHSKMFRPMFLSPVPLFIVRKIIIFPF